MTREEAIRKAAALRRLAQSSNPHEAATAAAHAQALMDRAGLDEAALALDGVQDDGPIIATGEHGAEAGLGPKPRARWADWLAVVVSQANGAHAYNKDGNLHIIGKAGALEATRYMYAWLRNEVQRLTNQHGRGLGVTWCNSFALGCVQTLKERLAKQHDETIAEVRAEAAQAINSGAALMRVERAIERVKSNAIEAAQYGRVNLHLRAGTAIKGKSNPDAREQGRAAGHSIGLGGGRQLGKG